MNQYTLSYDPFKKLYESVAPIEIWESCGLLTHFAIESFRNPQPLYETMLEQYGFPADPIAGGTINETGVYRYPGDPDLYPVMVMEQEERLPDPDDVTAPTATRTLFFYRYALIAIRENGQTIVTRMD